MLCEELSLTIAGNKRKKAAVYKLRMKSKELPRLRLERIFICICLSWHCQLARSTCTRTLRKICAVNVMMQRLIRTSPARAWYTGTIMIIVQEGQCLDLCRGNNGGGNVCASGNHALSNLNTCHRCTLGCILDGGCVIQDLYRHTPLSAMFTLNGFSHKLWKRVSAKKVSVTLSQSLYVHEHSNHHFLTQRAA